MEPYDIEPERALPAAAYRHESVAAERDRVWRGGWVFVGTSDQVTGPGDFVAVDLGGQPVIVLRNQDGDLAAMSNMCAHRGTLLVEGAGNTKRFQCPYHAWTYSDDGRLLAAPYVDRDDLDKEAHCLPVYLADEWHGLVFVSMDPAARPLGERFAHLDTFIEGSEISSLHHWTAERTDERWHANWKLVISNAMESYHLFNVHPETLEPYTPTAGAYYLGGSADGTATGGASTRGDDYVLLSLPPNFVGVITGGSLLWQAVFPAAADETRVVAGGAYPYPSPGASSGLSRLAGKAAAKVAEMGIPDFLPEDKAICERGQRAATGDYSPGQISPVEQVIVDFHHYLNRQLHGAATPPPRTSESVGIAKTES